MDVHDLDALLAREAITQNLYRYCRGMDRIDNDLANSVFMPGAQVEYGADIYAGPATGFVEAIAETHRGRTISHHQIGNILIEVDGEDAVSEAYVTVTLHRKDEEGRLIQGRGIGRYLDKWKRQGKDWKIAHRVYVHSIDEEHPVAENQYTVTGTRDETDISYRFFKAR